MTQTYVIPGFGRYRLVGESNDWQVLGPGSGAGSGRLRPLKFHSISVKGYVTPRVTMRDDGGVPRSLPVGRVVLLALVGPCPEGMECCHFDGDPFNNDLANLRWDTSYGNAQDTKRMGRLIRPPHFVHPNIKLTPDQVRAIRAAYVPRGTGQGERLGRPAPGSPAALAVEYDVSSRTIRKALRREV